MWPALHQLYPASVIPPTADIPELEPILFQCRIDSNEDFQDKEEDENMQAFYQVSLCGEESGLAMDIEMAGSTQPFLSFHV